MVALKLRIATRTSPLALFQTQEVIDRLEQTYNDWTFPIIPILTKGDKDQSTSLQNLDKQVFSPKA